MYGDQNRSPGRDDRQDGAAPRPAPWGNPYAPAHEDLKVAGSPTHTPPGHDTGFYGPGTHETNEPPGEPGPYGQGAPADGNATVAYDMGTSYGDEPPYGAGPGEPDAAGPTMAMPPYGGPAGVPDGGPPTTPDLAAVTPDFEEMRRTPHAGNKRLIRFAAVAAAVAVVGGGGVAWAISGGSSGKSDSGHAQAQAPAPAPLTDAQRKDAEDKRRKELKKRASRAARDEVVRPRLLARGTPPPSKSPGPGTAGDPVPVGTAQQIARAMLPDFGWSPSSQFGCLVNLWNKESHWNTHAASPTGAYGIPQALPGSKMASAGPDWQNNAHTQIKWGMGYIKSRYDSPCGAWAHSESTGWY